MQYIIGFVYTLLVLTINLQNQIYERDYISGKTSKLLLNTKKRKKEKVKYAAPHEFSFIFSWCNT